MRHNNPIYKRATANYDRFVSNRREIELGYKPIQFNFVISTNQDAIRIWTKLGFDTVGYLPKTFNNHPKKGYVDALVMYKWLET
jgi:ribosomal protein S18 acetylase RimI-like enzyme